MLISAVQRSDSVIFITYIVKTYIFNTYTDFFFIFSSTMVYHWVLNIVPHTIQWVLFILYIVVCVDLTLLKSLFSFSLVWLTFEFVILTPSQIRTGVPF